MAPPLSAYQMENFDPLPDEELICSICRCVFYDPVECPCRHVYCRTCISNWLRRQKTCPVCRKRASTSKLQTVVPIIKNMIMKLTIYCPNSEHGCKQKIALEAYDSHLANCDYEIVQCKNANCKVNCIRKDMPKHEQKECKFRAVKCRRHCSLMLPISSIKSHSCVEELKKELKDKKNLIEELKNEVENYKKQLQKVKNELQELKNQNKIDPFSDEEYASFDSDNNLSDHSFFINSSEDNDNLSDLSDNSHDTTTTVQNESDSERPYVSSFVNVLMSLFPNNSQDVRNNEQIEEISRYDINLRNINSPWERGRNNSSTTDEQVNPSSSNSMFNTNANESYDMVTTEIIDRHSKADRSELSTQRSRDVASTSENNPDTPNVDNERNNYSEDENPNESSDDMLVNNRKRILKRKSSLPVLSDISDDSINEPRRMRRRVRPLVESSEENVLEHGDEIVEITRPSHSHETCKGAEQNKHALSDMNIGNVRENKHTQRKTTERCQAPLSRVPVPVNSRESTENEDELQETETRQESQCLNQNDGNRTLSRLRSCNNQSEHHRTRSSLQRIFDFPETRRVQEALRFLENYNSSNQVENEGTNPSESGEWNTLRLINKYSDESDPDWEPPESEPEDTDFNSSDAIESDSSYEVQIPERTWDLLERYSQQPSDDDSDWELPGRTVDRIH